MTTQRLCILGAGNMGRALISGLLRSGTRAELLSVGESAIEQWDGGAGQIIMLASFIARPFLVFGHPGQRDVSDAEETQRRGVELP